MGMKLPVTQIVLGALVFIAAGFTTWWMISGVSELLDGKVLDESGLLVNNYTPANEALFTVSRHASVVLAALGLVVLATGALRKQAGNKKRLAGIQIVSGALTVALSAVILTWGYAFESIFPFEGGPELTKTYMIALTVLTAVLGLAIFAVGIALNAKLRKTADI